MHPIRGGRVWSLRKLSIPSGTTRITEEGAKCVKQGRRRGLHRRWPQNSPRVGGIDALSPPRCDREAGHPLTRGRLASRVRPTGRDMRRVRERGAWLLDTSGDEIAVNNQNKRARCPKKWQDSRRIGLVRIRTRKIMGYHQSQA